MASKEIITGQFVRIEQTPASLGERFFARLIDGAIVVFYLFAMVYVATDFSYPSSQSMQTFYHVIMLLLFSPVYAYSLLCEYFFEGRTIGKSCMNTRVVMTDGSAPTLGALCLRWLFEVIDFWCSGIGLLFIASTKLHQRIGDLAAGTMVIKNPNLSVMSQSLSEFSYASKDYRPIYPEAQNLSLGQADVIDRMLYGNVMYSDEQVGQLARKVCDVLKIKPRTDNQTQFLVDVLHDYQYYALQIV